MYLLLWLIDGLVVGSLSQLGRGSRRHRIMDMVMGSSGAIAGGFFVIALPFFIPGRLIFANLGAILGASVLIFLSRHLGASRKYDATILQRNLYVNGPASSRMSAFIPTRQLAYARSRKGAI